MKASRYELTVAQATYLETANRSSPNEDKSRSRQSKAQFPGALPPVTDQSVRGTCVANAVAALVACYEGCRRRVSVQYLDEVTRLIEQAWVSRNLKLLANGEPTERDFEAAFPDAVSQAALLVRANGAGSDAAAAFVRSLGTKIRARIEADAGCRLKRCFEALEEYGACREELWPYSPVAMNAGAAGGDAVGAFPPGTHEDAKRHRIVNGLYVLRAPNNVDEIKGILAGAQGRRPMPVCVGLELFEGRTDGGFLPPDIVHEDGHIYASQRAIGIHEVLIVGYTDDPKSPGGGYFTFLNSWGRDWGDAGMGRVSFAYVACFCREAGTILQEPGDYGPVVVPSPQVSGVTAANRGLIVALVIGSGLLAVAAAMAAFLWLKSEDRASVANQVPQVEVVEKPSHPAKPPAVKRKLDAKPKAVAVDQDEASDDGCVVEKIVDYRFKVRGACDSKVEAMAMAYALDREHREFTFDGMHLTDDRHGFEGEVTVEGVRGHMPDPIQAIEGYLKRKKLENAVRKWSWKRL